MIHYNIIIIIIIVRINYKIILFYVFQSGAAVLTISKFPLYERFEHIIIILYIFCGPVESMNYRIWGRIPIFRWYTK